jgi:hypothetical protein
MAVGDDYIAEPFALRELQLLNGLAIVRAHGGDVHADHAPQGFRLDIALPTAK